MWHWTGLLISGAAVVLLLGIAVLEAAGGPGWFWLLAFGLPLGPAVLLADIAGRLLGWRHRGRGGAALILWLVLPAAALATETESVAAQMAATILLALAAGVLLMTAISGALRAAAWLVDRRRRQRGLPSLSDTASERLGRLRPLEQAAVFLGGAALLIMATGLGIDTNPPDMPDGAARAVSLVVVRFWVMLQGVAISVLAGAIVLFIQARVQVRQEDPLPAALGQHIETQRRLPDGSRAARTSATPARAKRMRLGPFIAAASIGFLTGLTLRRRG